MHFLGIQLACKAADICFILRITATISNTIKICLIPIESQTWIVYTRAGNDSHLKHKYRYNSTIKNHYELIKTQLKFILQMANISASALVYNNNNVVLQINATSSLLIII